MEVQSHARGLNPRPEVEADVAASALRRQRGDQRYLQFLGRATAADVLQAQARLTRCTVSDAAVTRLK
jgi:hypothetical protein